MSSATIEWSVLRPLPAGLATALAAGASPWVGGYSFVYPVSDTQVVKLVQESGALEFLTLCHEGYLQSAHFPRVYDVLPGLCAHPHTGKQFTGVVMERLTAGHQRVKPYADAYLNAVRQLQPAIDCNVELSRAATVQAAQALQRVSLASVQDAMIILAREVSARQWVLDFANTDNWMLRPTSEGAILVLSDPVHHVTNFADDLV